jgi:hypothetical protein
MVSKIVRQATIATELLVSGNLGTMVRNMRRPEIPRTMYRRPLPKPWLDWSPRRLNTLVVGLKANTYLEIGVDLGHTAERVAVAEKVGVDPTPQFNVDDRPPGFTFFSVESDTYFASLDPEVNFDLIFLDGLHTFEQTKVDLFNALRHSRTGVILIDDTVPADEIAEIPDIDESYARRKEMGSLRREWMGDVWKLVVYIDRYLPQLDFRTIVGSGNEQTLVWRKERGEELAERPEDGLEGLTYRDMFADGIPSIFRTCSEAEAIRVCLAAQS